MVNHMNKWIYSYHEGDGKNKQLLGGKGANLCEITQIGLNVPPGFVIIPVVNENSVKLHYPHPQ
jgi:pyruvate,orthophosphate dikinase